MSDTNRPSGIKRLARLLYDAFSLLFIAFTAGSIVLARTRVIAHTPLETIRNGEHIEIPRVSWSQYPHTLVVAVSANCKACDAGATFYKALLAASVEAHVHVLLLSPDDPPASLAAIRQSAAQSIDVRRVDLRPLGILTTPTLIMVDSAGRVSQEWIGPLDRVDEDDVAEHLGLSAWEDYARLFGVAASALERLSPIITTQELLGMIRGGTRFTIIDVRGRADFERRHLHGSVNIPADELAVRAPHEVALDDPILLYCGFSAGCEADGRPSLCSQATHALESLGIRTSRVIRDPIRLLTAAGVPATGADGQ